MKTINLNLEMPTAVIAKVHMLASINITANRVDVVIASYATEDTKRAPVSSIPCNIFPGERPETAAPNPFQMYGLNMDDSTQIISQVEGIIETNLETIFNKFCEIQFPQFINK